MLSDLQLLLPSSREPAIEIEGVKVMQSPFHRVPRGNPLMTYIHLYNLTQDVWGKTLYTVRYLVAPSGCGSGGGRGAAPGGDAQRDVWHSKRGSRCSIFTRWMKDRTS